MAAISGITWHKYKQDVGYDAFNNNPGGTKNLYWRNYRGHGVSWNGYVVRVNLNEDDPLSMAFHSASLLIKMEEDDHEHHGADIGLSISEKVLEKYNSEIDGLHRGDYI